ncbi:hypothetical protein [Leucobacter chromiiresistens]|uniref:PPE family protein n=2 Tax=Leucobacter chromiiresistens TaxID=1079994 RepID=A0A1H0YA41_9MICO|nr:hypothetical protein [Leucobacter chromiiresistens]SDQ11980.1 hypothetical protein SAMN04488565_0671 [Leucobacter chromiiresistens]
MSEAERQLEEIASSSGWALPALKPMAGALAMIGARIRRLETEIRSGAWTGAAASTAAAHLHAAFENHGNANEWVNSVSRLLTTANIDIPHRANELLDALPSGDLPLAVWDAFSQGRYDVLTAYGVSAVAAGPRGLEQLNAHFADAREQAAQEARREIILMIEAHSRSVQARIETGFARVDAAGTSRGGGGRGGAEDGGPRSGGGSRGAEQPSGAGSIGSSAGGPTPASQPAAHQAATTPPPSDGSPVPGHPGETPAPRSPHAISDPNAISPGDPAPRPGRPGEGVGRAHPGDTGPAGVAPVHPGSGPSVDSTLDGSTLRGGPGSTAPTAAGLAAAARAAGIGGGSGVGGALAAIPGAAGTGAPGAAGGGPRGTASATAGNGTGRPSSAGSGGGTTGRGLRPGGVMMGGGSGGASEKAKPTTRFGRYVAPRLEDEEYETPPARASRAGSRAPHP